MTSLARFLTEDHLDCDGLFADAENAVSMGDWSAAGRQFEVFRAATLRHFAREEKVLFPAFETTTGMASGPTVVMRDEHEQMRQLIEAMADALSASDANAYLGRSETLLMLLRQHNLKEENVLYPMADQALGGQAADLLTQMAEMGA